MSEWRSDRWRKCKRDRRSLAILSPAVSETLSPADFPFSPRFLSLAAESNCSALFVSHHYATAASFARHERTFVLRRSYFSPAASVSGYQRPVFCLFVFVLQNTTLRVRLQLFDVSENHIIIINNQKNASSFPMHPC